VKFFFLIPRDCLSFFARRETKLAVDQSSPGERIELLREHHFGSGPVGPTSKFTDLDANSNCVFFLTPNYFFRRYYHLESCPTPERPSEKPNNFTPLSFPIKLVGVFSLRITRIVYSLDPLSIGWRRLCTSRLHRPLPLTFSFPRMQSILACWSCRHFSPPPFRWALPSHHLPSSWHLLHSLVGVPLGNTALSLSLSDAHPICHGRLG